MNLLIHYCMVIVMLISLGVDGYLSSINSVQIISRFPKTNVAVISDLSSKLESSSSSRFIKSLFIPGGNLTASYYPYSGWRSIQRLVSATNQVIGTQVLMIALGVQRNRIGLNAIQSWVLKDALGKLVKILFAQKYGKSFDINSKIWRFRSGWLYFIGNLLEILTIFYPKMFLITAAIANAFKQVALLSHVSTRNSIYRTFVPDHASTGDITAKGESQVAVVEMLGLFIGIGISSLIHDSSKFVMSLVFVLLSLLDLGLLLKEIGSIIHSSLNYDMTETLLRKYFSTNSLLTPKEMAIQDRFWRRPMVTENNIVVNSSFCVNDENSGIQSLLVYESNSLVIRKIHDIRGNNESCYQFGFPSSCISIVLSNDFIRSISCDNRCNMDDTVKNRTIALPSLVELGTWMHKLNRASQGSTLKPSRKKFSIYLKSPVQGETIFHALYLFYGLTSYLSYPTSSFNSTCIEEKLVDMVALSQFLESLEKAYASSFLPNVQSQGWNIHSFHYGNSVMG